MPRIAKIVVVVAVAGFGVGFGTLFLVRRHQSLEQQRAARVIWNQMSQLERDALLREAGQSPPEDDAPTLAEPEQGLVYSVTLDGCPTRGPHGAAVTIITFGDFQSSESRDLERTLRDLERGYPAKLRFGWKNLTVGRGAAAEKAAILGLLAAERGQFWEIHDALLAGKADPLGDDKLIALGVGAGIEERDIRSAWKDPARRTQLADDRFQARRFGIHRGPVVFVSGRFARFPVAAPALAALIDEAASLTATMIAAGTPPDMVYNKLMRGALPISDPLRDQQASAVNQ